jgi:AraC family transcriptional regulator
MLAEQVEDTLTQRFHIRRAPSLTARCGSKSSIAFSRMRNGEPMRGRSLTVPREEAFSFHVPLMAPFFSDLWIAGRFKPIPQVSIGDAFLFNLSVNPIVGLSTSFDSMRFYVPQVALDEMAYDRGLPRIGGLHSPALGRRDLVLYGLAQALAAAMERTEETSGFFTDYVALAFHDHIIHN